MTAVMATACGSKHTQTQETAAETTTEASDAETKAADTTKPDLSNVDPKMAEGPGAFETDESSEGVQVEEISGESWRSSRVRWLQSLKNGLQVLRKGACRDREE